LLTTGQIVDPFYQPKKSQSGQCFMSILYYKHDMKVKFPILM
jgi:hypothetical protein